MPDMGCFSFTEKIDFVDYWSWLLIILLTMEDSLPCSVSMSDGESISVEKILADKPSDCENEQHFDCSCVISSSSGTSQVQMEKTSEECNVEDNEEEEDENDGLSEEALLAQMGYDKSLCSSDVIEDNQGQNYDDVEEKEVEDEFSEELVEGKVDATPIDYLNLVSALKGSREKEGRLLAQECRVSWAPDVYDPIPAPPEEFAIKNYEMEESDGRSSAGKNRQKKGKGGGRKGADKMKDDGKADKKKGKKRGGSSGRRRVHGDY